MASASCCCLTPLMTLTAVIVTIINFLWCIDAAGASSSPTPMSTSNWAQNEQALFYIKKYEATSNFNHYQFIGNQSDYFKILNQDAASILIGGKNALYNLSLTNLQEFTNSRIEWRSSDAHRELCMLKGKPESECQNYIRVYGQVNADQFILCGTNSYKPVCRFYNMNLVQQRNAGNGEPIGQNHVNEVEAQGRCPYNPRHSSSYVFADGQLYSATVADFSSADPLIYREPQRTEQYDLKQLNQPDFISSYEYKEHVYFFFRETAMEFLNCGKAIYSRVGRICKNDKGGPYPFNNRWTTFVKTRLNCSVSGDYPFYFDELHSTSRIIETVTEAGKPKAIIYGVFQTPQNSIPGSAVCTFDFDDIEAAFEGRFKAQKDSHSNWLPIPLAQTPEPHPGKCVPDSRTMASNTVNFIRKHPLMEDSAPMAHNRPSLITVGIKHRLTAITVDPQVPTIAGDDVFDIIYVGTDDGRVIKYFNYLEGDNLKVVVISDVQVLPPNTRINELTLSHATESVIVVTDGAIVTTPTHYCSNLTTCDECVRDPDCTWHVETNECLSWRSIEADSKSIKNYLQDARLGAKKQCASVGGHVPETPSVVVSPTRGTVSAVGHVPHTGFPQENEITVTSMDDRDMPRIFIPSDRDRNNFLLPDQSELNVYSNKIMTGSIITSSVICLFLGLAIGFIISRRCTKHPFLANVEQRNHLNWQNKTRQLIHPRCNSKDVNLLMNANPPINGPPTQLMNITNNNNINNQQQMMNNYQPPHSSPKKDNLDHDNFGGDKDRTQEFRNSTESLDKDMMHSKTGTLQKVKKTYI